MFNRQTTRLVSDIRTAFITHWVAIWPESGCRWTQGSQSCWRASRMASAGATGEKGMKKRCNIVILKQQLKKFKVHKKSSMISMILPHLVTTSRIDDLLVVLSIYFSVKRSFTLDLCFLSAIVRERVCVCVCVRLRIKHKETEKRGHLTL